MNYQKHYDLLMKKAQSRAKPKGYTECHHIMPRSMGGSDDKSNLVNLTAREHFVAHYLWAKVHGGNQWYAVVMMKGQQCKVYNNSRLYEFARKNVAQAKSEIMKKLGDNHPMRQKSVVEKMSGDNNWTRKYPDLVKKHADARKGQKRPTVVGASNGRARKVMCVETGEVFEYMILAVNWLKSVGKKASSSALTNACKGVTQKSSGYTWRYV